MNTLLRDRIRAGAALATGFRVNDAGAPRACGLYDPEYEHDSCGVGLLADIPGRATHGLVEDAVRILINLEHRGAVGGDKATGDGAGLLLQVPDAFFRVELKKSSGIDLPGVGDYAVGMVFLPTDRQRLQRCVGCVEQCVQREGLRVLGWRDVPVNSEKLGKFARDTEPAFRQVFIDRGRAAPDDAFERKLYVIRREIEKEVASWEDGDYSRFYIASLSARTVVYKGMLTGSQLPVFFPDLTAPEFRSAFALVHQRYSTNTLPTWSLAQPFRLLAHNGEINTLRGNINRMRAREVDLASPFFGDDIEKIKPVIVEGGSDSAVFDNVLELLLAAGRSLPHAVMMMVPEAWGKRFHMSEDRRAMYEYHSAIMEPWDGPAALAFTDGKRYIGGTLDRNGLRPSRFTVTRDGRVILASESGVLEVESENILRRGRLQAGRMLRRPSAGRAQIGVELPEHLLHAAVELLAKQPHPQFLVRQLPQHRHGVVIKVTPRARRQFLEHILRILVPRPPQVASQPVQAGDGGVNLIQRVHS